MRFCFYEKSNENGGGEDEIVKRRYLFASIVRMKRATRAIQYFSVSRRDAARRRPRMTSVASVVSINTDFARAVARVLGFAVVSRTV